VVIGFPWGKIGWKDIQHDEGRTKLEMEGGVSSVGAGRKKNQRKHGS